MQRVTPPEPAPFCLPPITPPAACCAIQHCTIGTRIGLGSYSRRYGTNLETGTRPIPSRQWYFCPLTPRPREALLLLPHHQPPVARRESASRRRARIRAATALECDPCHQQPRTRHPDPPPRASAGTKLVFQAHSKPPADCLERRAHCELEENHTSRATARVYRSNGTCYSVIAATKASIADPPALRHPPQHSAPFVRRPGRPERNCG